MQACLCARKDIQSGFQHYGGPARLVQACLFGRKDLKAVFNAMEVQPGKWKPVYLPGKI